MISVSYAVQQCSKEVANHITVGQAGHGLNLEYDHPTTYATMLNYLVQNGLAPQKSSCSGGNNGGYGGKGKGKGHHGGRWHHEGDGPGKGWRYGPPSA